MLFRSSYQLSPIELAKVVVTPVFGDTAEDLYIETGSDDLTIDVGVEDMSTETGNSGPFTINSTITEYPKI